VLQETLTERNEEVDQLRVKKAFWEEQVRRVDIHPSERSAHAHAR
jgi:hypothetical protein